MQVTKETMAVAAGVVNYIETYPERHSQSSWFRLALGGSNTEKTTLVTEDNLCDTTMCIAGTAVFLTFTIEEFKEWDKDLEAHWEARGGELLGLDSSEASWLFYDCTNEEALKAVKAIAEGSQEKFDKVRHGLDRP